MAEPKPANRLRLFLGGLKPKIPILERYIGRELGLVVVLAAGVLTSLLALCGVLKPLRQQAISTAEMLEIIVLLFPVFLAFTLPFAVMLACCWVYGRLGADNELGACSSSGINIQRLLAVPLFLGLLCLGMNFWLSNWIIPNWALSRVEGMLARHGRDIIYRKIRRQGSVSISRTQFGRRCVIHADAIREDIDVLTGISVVVYQRGSEQIERIITAERAEVQFGSSGEDGDAPDTIAVIPHNATIVYLPEYSYGQADRLNFIGPLPSGISQHFNSMSLDKLQALDADPELYQPVKDSAQKARRVFMAGRLVETFYRQLADRDYFEMRGPEHLYRLKGKKAAAILSEEGAEDFVKDSVIEEYDLSGTQRQRVFFDVDSLSLELIKLPDQDEPTASIILRNAQIRKMLPVSAERTAGGADIEELEQTRYSLSGLEISEEILQQSQSLSLASIRKTDLADARPPRLKELGEDIAHIEERMRKNIALEIHSRLAIAASCPVLAVLGALLGTIFRKGQFLAAVGLCLGPAMISLLFVIMGKRMVDSPVFSTNAAITVSWTGLGLLSLAIVILTVKVVKR